MKKRQVGVRLWALGAAVWLGMTGGTAVAAPEIEIDSTEEIVLVSQGMVVTQSLNILNNGDATLNWTLSDRVQGEVVKDFASPWTSAASLRYDTTRNCLWLAYYYSSELKKVSTSSGSILATKNMGSACTRPYGMEIENGFVWVTDYTKTRFVKLNLDNMSVAGQTPFPSGWTQAYGLAIGGGSWYATYNGDYNDIYRLNPSTGAVQSTYDEVECFYYYHNHISYADNGIWYGAYYSPKNELRKYDLVKERIRRSVVMPDWDSAQVRIKDQAFVNNDSQVWVLTYRHDYADSGQSKYWIHLLDVSALSRFTAPVDSGSVPPTDSRDIDVVFDGSAAEIGINRVNVALDSNGGSTQEKPFLFVVHAPGANSAPTADAGPDQTIDATGPIMTVTLDGSGSSDPNGDELVYEWLMAGGSTVDGESVTVELSPGVHDITLTVEDLRGGVDTDTVRITIRAPDIEVDDCFVLIPEGSGAGTGTVTIRNSGDRTLNWSVSEAVQLDQSSIIKEFEINWVSSYSTYAYPYTMTYDTTRDCLWVGYYYDNEIGKIDASNGSTITTKSVADGRRIYALDMEGADLWTADYYEKKFRKYNPDTMANTQTINSPWGTGNGPTSLARDSGEFYASQYFSYDICKLNNGSGAVVATHPVGERQYYYNHHDAINGKVWYTRYNAPKTRVHCIDGTSGNLLTTLDMGHWNTSGQIYDLSFVNSTQCWMLTYNVKGSSKRRGHLVDLSAGARFSKTATSGAVPAGGTGTFNVSYDATGLPLGRYTVALTFASDDPDEPTYEKDVVFVVHEDAPNNPPVANAGPDRTEDIPGLTAPFVLDLSGAGSSDPDGDPLRMLWTWSASGEPVELTDKGLLEVGAGSHGLTLTVEDYRGGTDTDELVLTVNANVGPADWPQYAGPNRNGTTTETDWLENWPPIHRWSTYVGGGYGAPILSGGRVYSHRNGKAHCLDASTGAILWSTPVPQGSDTCTENYCRLGGEHPCVDDRHLYVHGSLGMAVAVRRNDGGIAWQVDLGPIRNTPVTGCASSPFVIGDLVIFQGVALNCDTGEIVWKGYDSGYNTTSGFDWEGRTWLCHYGYMTDPLTGARGIRLGYTQGRGAMTPVWFDGDKFFDTSSVRSIGSASTIWSESYQTQYGHSIVWGNYGYLAHDTSYKGGEAGTLKCIDIRTGVLKWTGPTVKGFMAADGKVIVSLRDGGIQIIKAHEDGDANALNPEGRDPYVLPGGVRPEGYGAPPVLVDKRIYIGGKHITCLDLALSAPDVENREGCWDASTAQAILNGNLINTGGLPAAVCVYWGTSDGGTDSEQWDHCKVLGDSPVGPFSTTVSGLSSNTAYFYRCAGSNRMGRSWATGTERLYTFAAPSVDGEGDLLLHWAMDQADGSLVEDRSGHDNHGVISGSHHWGPGAVGNALGFGYDSAFAPRVACRPLSLPLTERWTLACWVKYETSGQLLTLSQYPIGGEFAIRLGNDGTISVDGHGSMAAQMIGGWHHLAVVRDGGTTHMYIDGVHDRKWGSKDFAYRYFSAGNITAGKSFRGYLDDVRLYRRALAAREIIALAHMNGATNLAVEAVNGTDDAEEAPDGDVTLDNAELGLGETTESIPNVVGLRFAAVDVPRRATILGAVLQFGAAASDGEETVLTIQGEASDHAAAFAATAGNLSGRPRTRCGVPWVVSEWTVGAAGPVQQTPNLAGVVQEVVDRPGWTNGHALAFFFAGRGHRQAYSADSAGGTAPRLSILWTEKPNLDDDPLPDRWERTWFAAAPSTVNPLADPDGDGAINFEEYVAGTDATDSDSVLRLRVRSEPPGRIVVGFDSRAAAGVGYEGMARRYSIETIKALSLRGGVTTDLWLEDFDLPDGTAQDTNETAWATTKERGTFQVSAGRFMAAGTVKYGPAAKWISDVIPIGGRRVDLSVDIRCEGGKLDSTDYIKVFYSLDSGPEILIAERYDDFNGGAWETVGVKGLLGWTARIIVRQWSTDAGEVHFWDNVRISHTAAAWSAVPGVSNILVNTSRTVLHTNSTPAARGFYRVKARLE